MKENYFSLENKIKEINTKFIKDGWVKVYESSFKSTNDSSLVYCCLVEQNKRFEITEDYNWPISMGYEGKPSIGDDNSYKTNDQEGIEPFIFYRSFPLLENDETYFDISEEFIFYFNLYEKLGSKQNRKYYYIDEVGNMDEVIVVEPNLIRIRLKYLKEYITMRDMNFVVCFDYMRVMSTIPREWNIEYLDNIIKNENGIYNHLTKNIFSGTQNWIVGNICIEPNQSKSYHADLDNKYESFITGFNEEGDEIYEDCSKSNEKYFKTTFFKKEVLNKYYNEPNKYEVNGFGIRSKYFSLKIDNNRDDYVPVFLVELSSLPYKEQLHWKQYNISPQDKMNISRTYYSTMIEGNWDAQPSTPDFYFKMKYCEFNKSWYEKFGWEFYKPLSDQDKHLLTSLHIPTTNNVKSFCEQILSIVKLTIDRLNEKNLQKGLTLEKGVKGITKFEKFLKSYDIEIPDLFEFLRNLQSLRSGLMAHTFSKSDKQCRKAFEYFNLKNDNYIEVAKEIFIKSVYTLNILETQFNLDNK